MVEEEFAVTSSIGLCTDIVKSGEQWLKALEVLQSGDILVGESGFALTWHRKTDNRVSFWQADTATHALPDKLRNSRAEH